MNLLELVKKTHAPFYILIDNNKQMITINEYISVISVVNITNIDIEFNDKYIKINDELLNPISTTFTILKNAKEAFNNNDIEEIKFDKHISIFLKNKYSMIDNYSETYYVEDLKNESVIQDLMNSKAADGQFKLKIFNGINKYLLTLFKGIIPLNKPDIVSLSILEKENNNIDFFARFDIYKKKNKIFIEEYINYKKV